MAIDLEAQSGVYISGGLWVGGKANLEALIQVTLGGSLRALWNFKGGNNKIQSSLLGVSDYGFQLSHSPFEAFQAPF